MQRRHPRRRSRRWAEGKTQNPGAETPVKTKVLEDETPEVGKRGGKEEVPPARNKTPGVAFSRDIAEGDVNAFDKLGYSAESAAENAAAEVDSAIRNQTQLE